MEAEDIVKNMKYNLIESISNKKKDISIKYKITGKFIKIFGDEFVKKNKNNIKIIINNKEKEYIKEKIPCPNKSKDILEIELEFIKKVTDLSYMFYDCSSLLEVYFRASYDHSSDIIDLTYMFGNCSSLISVSIFYISKIKNINGMFSGCASLKSLPDINDWDTSNITNMSFLFNGCSSLLSLPDITDWNTSNVNDMSWMFNGCRSLTSSPDISKWDTSKVNNMSAMFNGCSGLKSLPDINEWDISNVDKKLWMFNGCNDLLIKNLNKKFF